MSQTNYNGPVGYIGLGNMGGGIATHLAQVGMDLTVFDLNPEAIARLEAQGAKGASGLEELAKAVDVVIVCVDPEPAVKTVIEKLHDHLRPGQTVIIQSSVPPAWVIDMAKKVEAKGVKLYDAAVSGSHEDRLNGTLSVLTGATVEEVGKERTLLETIGRPLYLGSTGGGEVAKLANNAVMMATRLAMIETMEFGRAYGVSEEQLAKAISISSGASWVLDNWKYMDIQVKDGTTARQSLKQAEEILKTAAERGVRLRMTEALIEHTDAVDAIRYNYLTGKDPELSPA